MPVDLSPAGLPSALPVRCMRLVRWLLVWLLCLGIGAPLVLLLWPSGVPAQGLNFWLALLGFPSVLFLLVVGIARSIYEADYIHARYRNRHRDIWLNEQVRTAQRPLHVLGAGYCMPYQNETLGDLFAGQTSRLEACVPRNGSGLVLHSRFDDEDPRLYQDVELSGSTGAADSVHPMVLAIQQALTPLVDALQALSRYGPKYAPAVRVLCAHENPELHLNVVKQALKAAGLPELDCTAVSGSDGLMVADAWLDARDHRPLLVIAAEWHDTALAGTTEGAVAVLLDPGVFQLPASVSRVGVLHRPVAGSFDDLEYVLANSVLWGAADDVAVSPAWISGWNGAQDTKLLSAAREVGLPGIEKPEAQRQFDRLIGNAGVAGGWLSVAAALEAGPGTQLVLHQPNSTFDVQAAILHVAERMNEPEQDSDE